jgi:hypothetical protein
MMQRFMRAAVALCFVPALGARALAGRETLTIGAGDGVGTFRSDQFGGTSDGQFAWNPFGAIGNSGTAYNTYVVVSNRAETTDPGLLTGYALTIGGAQPGTPGGGHFIAADPNVVLYSDVVAATSRTSSFNLPVLGAFRVTLTQTVSDRKLTQVYAIKNEGPTTRRLTLTYTSDTDIEHHTDFRNNVGFHRFSKPAEIGFTDAIGTIGAFMRASGGQLEGWRVWQARGNGILEPLAVAARFGIPREYLNVFARTAPSAPTEGGGAVNGFGFQTDHLGDQNGDGFTDPDLNPNGWDGDIGGSVQSILTIPPGQTRTLTTEYEYFGELPTGVQVADRDADTVPDFIDNCPDDYNPDQADAFADGVGDACMCDDTAASCDAPYVYGVVRTAAGLASIRCREAAGVVDCDTQDGVLVLGPPLCGNTAGQ